VEVAVTKSASVGRRILFIDETSSQWGPPFCLNRRPDYKSSSI
jgi:hypothetical protein